MKFTIEGVSPLPHLGLIRAVGEDAAKFLHGQLTQDVVLLGADQARLAAFCSAQGRMQASFIVFKRSGEELLLVCDRELVAPMLKRLSMFVLRAKVKLSDASAEYALYGLAGKTVDELAPGDHAPWRRATAGDADLLHLYPADGVPRALWLAPMSTPTPQGPALSEADWLWGEVRSGVVLLRPPVVDAFVPQMLNYESVGGVNFKKGCYPGQEVVARSQFRGTLKRRGQLVRCAQAMLAGDELYDATEPEQPCARVALAARAPDGRYDAFVSMKTMAEGAALRLGSATGAEVTLQPLPYPLLEDI